MTGNVKKQQYELLKCELDEIYDEIAKDLRVRSRCHYYKEGEKSSKFFINSEKTGGSLWKTRKVITRSHKITELRKREHEIIKIDKLFTHSSNL